jgi:hypothetical protein
LKIKLLAAPFFLSRCGDVLVCYTRQDVDIFVLKELQHLDVIAAPVSVLMRTQKGGFDLEENSSRWAMLAGLRTYSVPYKH